VINNRAILLALGRASYARFRARVDRIDPTTVVPPWDQLSDGARIDWSRRLDYLVPVVQELIANAERGDQ
jgi:hypothetical protein